MVSVDADGLLARRADLRSTLIGRRTASFGGDGLAPTHFVADELLVDAADPDLIGELVREFGAEELPSEPVEAPEGLELEVRELPADRPRAVRLRFAEAPPIDGQHELLRESFAGRRDGVTTVTSDLGAATAAVAARYALAGQPVGLNLLGAAATMPLSVATEGAHPAGTDTFAWPAFAGRTSLVRAWQLMSSFRTLAVGGPPVVLAVFDCGYGVDANGVDTIADLGAFGQINLMMPGTSVGGMSIEVTKPWHGSWVASVAAGRLGNAAGTAGSAGVPGAPVTALLFRTDYSLGQLLDCVQMCTAWGVDVLNLSFSFGDAALPWFIQPVYDAVFAAAEAQDLVIVAAAGNEGVELTPDSGRRPAAGTPTILTVGALGVDDKRATFTSPTNPPPMSNWGSEVDLWAPGTGIPVGSPTGTVGGGFVQGTSFAAPMVAGVAALMRVADPGLSAAEVRRLLVATAWDAAALDASTGPGFDAYQALLAALRRTLPDAHEPNSTPAEARTLVPTGPGGALEPTVGGFTSRSSWSDTDHWRFDITTAYAMVTVVTDFYDRIASLQLTVEAVDAGQAAGPAALTTVRTRDGVSVSGLLAAGRYRVKVSGNGLTAYRLRVTRTVSGLPQDRFEVNDSFDDAAPLLFETPPTILRPFRSWGPGTYEATLHRQLPLAVFIGGRSNPVNDDYFVLHVPEARVLQRPRLRISDCDWPVVVTVYDEQRNALRTWPATRELVIDPPPKSTCYVKVAGDRPTRYRIGTGMRLDRDALPGPLQEELELVPTWWGDPAPLRLIEDLSHYAHVVTEDRGAGGGLALMDPGTGITAELLDAVGTVLRSAEAADGLLWLDTSALEPGPYVLRLRREAGAGDEVGGSVSDVRVLPPPELA